MEIPCICPPKGDGTPRHTVDRIELHERLDFRAATTIRNALAVMYTDDPDAGIAEVLAVVSEHYLVFGVESWSLVDEANQPVPCTKGNIRSLLLTRYDEATLVADAADDLYQEQVMLPLLRMASTSSQPGPTSGSTSVPSGSPEPPPMPSSPSLTTTTPTASTEPITLRPDGGSKSSRKSQSVA